MGISQTYNFDTAANFTKVNTEISGTTAILSKTSESGQTFNQNFSSDSGFTYNSSLVEFTGGKMQQKDQTESGSIFAAKFVSSFNQNWNKIGGSLTGTLNGTPTLSGTKLVCSGTQGVYFAGTTAAIETHRIKYTPNYTGAPATNLNIISGYNGTNNNERWSFTHSPSGSTLRFTLYDQTGTIIIATATAIGAAWSPTSGTEYVFGVILDSTAGTVTVNIDGALHGTLSPGTWTRGGIATRYYVGASPQVYNTANGSFRDYEKFNSNAPSGGSYSIPDYIYLTSPATLPSFTYSRIGTLQSFTSMTTTEANIPHYFANGKYWNGSAWVTSDGSTYAQANTLATFTANLPTLTASDTLTIGVIFPNQNSQAYVDDLTVTYVGQQYYAEGYLYPVQGVDVQELLSYSEDSSGSSVGVVVSVDGVLKYWDGAAISTSDGTFSQSNDAATILAHIGEFVGSMNSTVVFRWILFTADTQVTPTITSATLSYDFGGVEISPAVCLIYGYCLDIAGEPVEGVSVTPTLVRSNKQYREAAGNVIEKSLTVTSDVNGYFEFNLIRTSEYEAGGTYHVTFIKTSDNLDTEYTKGTTQITFSVPDADMKNITDLITALP